MIGGAFFIYLYNKPHRNIAGATTDIKIQAGELYQKYSENEGEANELFLDKVIEVKGQVRAISQADHQTSIILDTDDEMFGIACTLNATPEELKDIQEGQNVAVKGLCVGMLSDVVLIKCSLIPNGK